MDYSSIAVVGVSSSDLLYGMVLAISLAAHWLPLGLGLFCRV
jgi:hypothetical protein